MSEQKHTPEPWEVFSKNGVVEIWNCARKAIIGWTGFDSTRVKEKAKDNARRIVACVNACAGIPTKLLEDSKCWAEAGIETATSLRKQRDDLLAALQSISKITGDAGFNIGGPLEHCPGEIDHDEAKRLLSRACEYLKDISKAAHRAIASAKGGA